MTEDQRAQPGQVPGGPDVEANTGQQPDAPGIAGRAPEPEPGTEAAGVAGAGVPEASAAARVAELEAKCSALQDQYLRAVAEVENVRRRGQEEVAKAHKFGIEGFAESLLPVCDSLELALSADDQSIEHLREGVEVTLRQLMVAFEKNRLQMIDPAGQKFDPNLHQAIAVVPGDAVNPAVAPNHVVSVLQKGFLINDRVLRPALVTVAQP